MYILTVEEKVPELNRAFGTSVLRFQFRIETREMGHEWLEKNGFRRTSHDAIDRWVREGGGRVTFKNGFRDTQSSVPCSPSTCEHQYSLEAKISREFDVSEVVCESHTQD
jgi:hypothetical protein